MFIHNRIRKLLSLVVVMALMSACASSKPQPEVVVGVDAELGTLVTTEWLSQHLDDPDLVVLDCTVRIEQGEDGSFRPVSGRSKYESGHIPSAGFADLMNDLSDSNSPYQFAVPTPEEFSAAMGALGVGDGTRVVLYDGTNSVWAARVWWMLRWVGFDQAALLDGGLKAWTAEGRPLSTEPANRQVQQLTPSPRPGLIADRNEVLAAIDNDDINIIDALPEAHYSGGMSMYARPGHIPGATNTPSSSLIVESGHYKPYDELAAMLGDDHDTRTITYCGGGISASSDAFIMIRLGFTDVAVYTASLQEWAADKSNPMVVDTP